MEKGMTWLNVMTDGYPSRETSFGRRAALASEDALSMLPVMPGRPDAKVKVEKVLERDKRR
jgi:hypothetical protein